MPVDLRTNLPWPNWSTDGLSIWIRNYGMILIDLDAKQAMHVPSTFFWLLYSLVQRWLRCSLISYTKATKDYMVPSVWGTVDKKDDPYAPAAQGGCCIIMWVEVERRLFVVIWCWLLDFSCLSGIKTYSQERLSFRLVFVLIHHQNEESICLS